MGKGKKTGSRYRSPMTGKTPNDYALDAYYASGLPNTREFAKICGLGKSTVDAWPANLTQPSIASMILIERATGRKIADYLPEVARGIELLQRHDEWRGAFHRCRMQKYGIVIHRPTLQAILDGCDLANTSITLDSVVKIVGFYDWWMANKERLREYRGYRERGTNQHTVYGTADSDEEEKALKAYHWAMQSYNAKMYDLHRIRDYVWEFGTIHWRCELDLILKELRIYWRKTGALNSTRPFDADTLKDNARIIRKEEKRDTGRNCAEPGD